MAEISGKFLFPDGLTPGQSRDGGLSQLLFDEFGNLADHGTFIPDDEAVFLPDDDEFDSVSELVAAVLVVVGVAGLVVAAPHFKRWWQEKASPRMKTMRMRVRRGGSATEVQQVASDELATLSRTAPSDFSDAIDVALDDCSNRMGSDEAQRRLAAMLAASAFIAEQMRMLSNVRIEDDADFPELSSAIGKLTTQQVTDSINRMLESNASLLDEETSSEFMKLFGGGGFADGQYVPLRNERITEALRLPDRER